MTSSSSESEFYFTITRVAVAQICRTVGYKAAQTSALEILADIAGRYIRAIANSATASANSGGRIQCNLFDITVALEGLGSVQGFIGAHEMDGSHCLISSFVLKEIMGFVYRVDEIPFAQPLPRKNWPELKKRRNEMGLRHVPRWLPEMPAMIGIGMEKEGNGDQNFSSEESGDGDGDQNFSSEESGDGDGDQNFSSEESGDGDGDQNFSSEESREGKGGNGKVKVFELPEKRGKVKFKMGMGGRVLASAVGKREFGIGTEMRNNVVFSRGGYGKRILCQSWNDDDGNEE